MNRRTASQRKWAGVQSALSGLAVLLLGIALASGSIQLGPITIPQSALAGVCIALAGAGYLVATIRGTARRQPVAR